MNKDLLTPEDLSFDEITDLINTGIKIKHEQLNNISEKYLEGKTLGMIFDMPSTRTRVSFEAGMYQLGGQALFLSANDLQLRAGETFKDTARVISGYIDAIVVRTNNQKDLSDFAMNSIIPVINGMTDLYHPCQVLADLMTIFELRGRINDLKIAYIGDNGNMLNTYLKTCKIIFSELRFSVPELDDITKYLMGDDNSYYCKDPREAAKDADVIVTDRWTSNNSDLIKFTITEGLVALSNKAVVLHKLPAARGKEISETVFENHKDDIFSSSDNRLHIQKALLLSMMS